MIHIKRGPEPEFLRNEKVIAAKDKLRKSFEDKNRQERIRFDISLLGSVKENLMEMCHHKCAYCESRLGIVGMGDVENFRPKAGARGSDGAYAPDHYWWLAYEWDNLLIACQICNQKYKRDYFPLEEDSPRARIGAVGPELLQEKNLLIDPCLDEPEEHLKFHEDGHVQGLTPKGSVTIKILGLNRNDLVLARYEHNEAMLRRLRLLEVEQLPSQEELELVDYIRELFSDNPAQQYAGSLRAVFNGWFERNARLWERIKRSKNDYSETIKIKSFAGDSSGAAEAIARVEAQLSHIKRFSIKSVEIENFKSIERLSLSVWPVHEKESRESWLLILGDNGIGKSSILQAIALALAGKKQLAKMQPDVADFLRHGTSGGKVVIQSFEQDEPITLRFDADGFHTELEEAPTFVLAYGSTRLLPKGNIRPDLDQEPYLNIRNLFDYSVSLNDPHEWLRNIDPMEFKERVAPAFFDLLALRGDDRLWVNEGKICIQQFGVDQELEDNSDGYKTIVALVADIMKTLSIDSANYHNAQGIVLIDEIGIHLHPRWRLKIVSALRKAFPKLQFIVTTHEPLCLRGLSHGEVVVLVRDQQNSVRALDQQLLPDHSVMRIEQLLTSDLFGLINVMDEETEKNYEQYYQLLSKKEEEKTEEDRSKIQEIGDELAKKEVLGATPVQQAYYKIVSETFAQKIREEGFKTQEELKEETVSQVKEIIKQNYPDWL